ncbi:MAG TPA: DMT family transporter [Geobacteraceae bacterium]|nr:DMT family transporter [Geobacteraceae bacterium]
MHLLWVPVTICCAFSLATSDALTKKALAARHNEYLTAWVRLLIMVPPLLIVLLANPVPPLGSEFFPTILAALPIELLALILYFKALKLSPLGLTVPFLAMTPVFLIVIPYLLLGERITLAGGAGIILIAIGSYTLNLHNRSSGLLAPFRTIFRDRGSLCMMAVAVLYAFTATLAKKAINCSSPLFFAGLYPILLFVCLTPVALWKGWHELRRPGGSGIFRATLLPAFFSLGETITGVIALSLTNVAYMIAVKRLSLLMGIVYGHVLFREEELRERLAGGGLMVAGVALIVVGGR